MSKENYKVIGVQVSEDTHRIIKEASAYYSQKEGRFISIRELIHRYVQQLEKEMNQSQQNQ